MACRDHSFHQFPLPSKSEDRGKSFKEETGKEDSSKKGDPQTTPEILIANRAEIPEPGHGKPPCKHGEGEMAVCLHRR